MHGNPPAASKPASQVWTRGVRWFSTGCLSWSKEASEFTELVYYDPVTTDMALTLLKLFPGTAGAAMAG